MLNSLASFIKKTSPNEAPEAKNSRTKKHIVYRDELSKVKPKKKGNNWDSLESSEPLINKDLGSTNSNAKEEKEEEKGVVRVKVKMTKEEANLLLSMSKEGVIDFKDVTLVLANLPSNRITVLSLPSSCSGGSVLKSIPEDSQV